VSVSLYALFKTPEKPEFQRQNGDTQKNLWFTAQKELSVGSALNEIQVLTASKSRGR